MLTAKLQKGKNKARYFEFLIDSGADYTLISKSDAYLLGIEYEKIDTKEIEIEVANLSFIHAKKSLVKITVGNHSFNTQILIAKEGVERLIGRKGLFTEFKITFKEKENTVIFNKC